MNPIFQGLAQGHTPQQILSYIARAFPQFSGPIKKASSSGYNAKQILGFLSKNFETEDRTAKSESELHAINRRADAERSKHGLTMVGGALAAPGLATAARSALSRALPATLGPFSALPTNANNTSGTSLSPQPPFAQPGQGMNPTQAQLPNQLTTSSSQPPNVNGSNLSQPINIQQPEENISQDLEREQALEQFNKKAKKKGILEEEIERFEKGYGKQPTTNLLPKSTELVEESKPISKNSIVSVPNGIGQVKEIRNGKAIVDIDGKLHKVNEDELDPSLYSEDEIADAYDNLMAKIPEEHKSGFISWAGYDPERNVIGFIPRGGKYEELTEITPEEAEKIKEGKGVARTSGETREGLWVMGEDTRGGIISQIIHDRRKKHKEAEEKQGRLALELPKKEKQDRGMKPLFDEMAHARNLSREREKRKKDEAKKRKKQA